MSVIETYHKHVKVGESQGWCGPSLIVLVLKPFTPGEDAVIAWAMAQDETQLLDMVHLHDGRDYAVLARRHVKQTLQDALKEQQVYLASLRATTQHDTPASL